MALTHIVVFLAFFLKKECRELEHRRIENDSLIVKNIVCRQIIAREHLITKY